MPRPSDAPLPSCLDQTIKDQLGAELKPRGVQKRNFAKDKKIVLVAHGGDPDAQLFEPPQRPGGLDELLVQRDGRGPGVVVGRGDLGELDVFRLHTRPFLWHGNAVANLPGRDAR